jgi:serine/threonine-protein phosphatase PGAM5
MPCRTLLLVRHGEMDAAAFGVDQFTAGLSERGRRQVRRTATALHPRAITAIHCSSMGRAKQTAQLIADAFPEIPVRCSRLLWELPNVGPTSDPAWQHVFQRGIRRGERAFRAFVWPTCSSVSCEMLVTHGNLIRYFVCRVLGIRPELWSVLGTAHCGITELRIDSTGPRLITYNSTCHLPASLLT